MGENEVQPPTSGTEEEVKMIKKGEECLEIWEEMFGVPEDIPQGKWTASDGDERYCAGVLNADGVNVIYVWEQRSEIIVGECQVPDQVTHISLTPQATIAGFSTITNNVIIQTVQKPTKPQYNIHLQHSKHTSTITQLCWGHNGLYSSDIEGNIYEFDWMTSFEPRLLTAIGEPILKMSSNTFDTPDHTGIELLVLTSRRVLQVHQINGMVVTILKRSIKPLGACFLNSRYTLILFDKTIQLFDGVEAELLTSSVKKVQHGFTNPVSLSILRNNFIAVTDGSRLCMFNPTFTSLVAEYHFEGDGCSPQVTVSKKAGFTVLTPSTVYRVHAHRQRSPQRISPTFFVEGCLSPDASPGRPASQRRTLKEQVSVTSSIVAVVVVIAVANPFSEPSSYLSSGASTPTDLTLPEADISVRRTAPIFRTVKKLKTTKTKIKAAKKTDASDQKPKQLDVNELVKLRDPITSETAKLILKMSHDALQTHYEEKQAIIKVRATHRAMVIAGLLIIASDWSDNIHQRAHDEKLQAIITAAACLLPISTIEVQRRIYTKDIHYMAYTQIERVLNRVDVQIDILVSESAELEPPPPQCTQSSESESDDEEVPPTAVSRPRYKLTGPLIFNGGDEEGGILWKTRAYSDSPEHPTDSSHPQHHQLQEEEEEVEEEEEEEEHESSLQPLSFIAVYSTFVILVTAHEDTQKQRSLNSLIQWVDKCPLRKMSPDDFDYRRRSGYQLWKWKASKILSPASDENFISDVVEGCLQMIEKHNEEMVKLGSPSGEQVVYEMERTSMWNSNWDEVLSPPEYKWSWCGEPVCWDPINDPDLLPKMTLAWESEWRTSPWEYSNGNLDDDFVPTAGYFSVLRRRLWSRSWCCPLAIQNIDKLKNTHQQEIQAWAQRITNLVFNEPHSPMISD